MVKRSLIYEDTCNVIHFTFQDVKNSKGSIMTVAHHGNFSFYPSPLPLVSSNSSVITNSASINFYHY